MEDKIRRILKAHKLKVNDAILLAIDDFMDIVVDENDQMEDDAHLPD